MAYGKSKHAVNHAFKRKSAVVCTEIILHLLRQLTLQHGRLPSLSLEGVKAWLHYVESKMDAQRNCALIHGFRLLLVFRCDRFCTCNVLSIVAVIIVE